MKLTVIGVVAMICMAVTPPCSADAAKALTNADVVQMVKAGLPDSTILLSIQGAPAEFKTAPSDLIALKNAGVPQPVMDAMLTRGSGAVSAGGPPPTGMVPPAAYSRPAAAQGVVVVEGDQRVSLKTTVHTFASGIGFTPASFIGLGGKTKNYVVLPGAQSDIRFSNRTPVFEVFVPEQIHAEQALEIIHFSVKGDTRKALQMYYTHGLDALTQKSVQLKEGRVPFTMQKPSDGETGSYGSLYQVLLTAPLEPGEYAVYYSGNYWDFGVD